MPREHDNVLHGRFTQGALNEVIVVDIYSIFTINQFVLRSMYYLAHGNESLSRYAAHFRSDPSIPLS